MKKTCNKIKLTTDEKNVLDKLTHFNKMDCWFWIDDDTDTIRDLENGGEIMDTREAILTIAEGVVDIENILDQNEITTFNALVSKCK